MPKNPSRRPWALLAATLGPALLLAACGGGGGATPHDAPSLDTAGRLALAEQDSPVLRLHDLDRPADAPARHTLEHAPAALYASPGGRYVLALQRLQDQVQFVDGGVWQEDHGDHLHDYAQASRLLSWRLAGVRPTHYDLQAGRQAAIFMDGNAAATPVQPAGVRLLTEAGIGAGQVAASLDLAAPLHGLGEPVDELLLAAQRAADAADALPTHLALYRRNGSAYTFERTLPTRCDGMHGSYSSGRSTVAGCSDGVLLVRHAGSGATAGVSERKLAAPLRISTLAGHPRLPDRMIGIATEGSAPGPVTTRFYAIDGEAASLSELVLEGFGSGRVRRAHGFDRSGSRFYVLDDQGTLIVTQRQGAAWVPLARIAGAVPRMPSAAPFPALVANGARDEIYLTDPLARQLVVVDTQRSAVSARRELGYVPVAAAWTGITR